MTIGRIGIGRSGIGSSGIGVSGIPPVVIPSGARDFYDFSQLNANAAVLELVGKVNTLSTVRASNKNVIKLNGSSITYGSNVAGLISGDGLLGEGSATAENNDSDIVNGGWGDQGVTSLGSQLVKNGYTFGRLDEDTSNGRHSQFIAYTPAIGDATAQMIISRGTSQFGYLGVAQNGGIGSITIIFDMDAVTVTQINEGSDRKHISSFIKEISTDIFHVSLSHTDTTGGSPSFLVAGMSNSGVPVKDASFIPVYTGTDKTMFFAKRMITLKEFPNSFILTSSAPATRAADDLSISTSNWVDESRIGLYGLSLQTTISNQVLWESGDSSLSWNGTNLVADINGTTATIAVADPTTLSSAYWEYDDNGDLFAIADGVRGTGVASSAPSFGSNANLLSDELVANHAQGVAGKFIVQDPTKAIIT